MTIELKGAAIYLSAADIEALHHAHDHLSTRYESASVEVPELVQALAGVHSILDKVSKARKARTRGAVVAKALKVADNSVKDAIAAAQTILETVAANGVSIWIDKDLDPRYSIYMLDCGFDRAGFKAFGELPRIYRTERGARQAAALLTEEKLVWSAPHANTASE